VSPLILTKGLENRRTRKGSVGSNPTPSAKLARLRSKIDVSPPQVHQFSLARGQYGSAKFEGACHSVASTSRQEALGRLEAF
jgi:hypothetical protein